MKIKMRNWRKRVFEIVEKSEDGDRESRLYDFFMLMCITFSLIPLMARNSDFFLRNVEVVTTMVFIVDYILRLATADFKLNKGGLSFLLYPFTPMAIVDLLSILPSLILFDGSFYGIGFLVAFRSLRVLRVIRVFKVLRYSKNISLILNIFRHQREPLMIVGALVFGYVIVVALVMFNVEPNTFRTFGDAVYWSVVSLTTIGYGDIFAQSGLGKFITVISAMMGVAVFALPAGIITAGYMEELNRERNYKLIAFDLDGTLLNSQKEISQPTLEALKKAADEGKEIAIATGRSLSGVMPYMDQLSMVHFGILSSATIIYDFWEEKVISMDNIAWDHMYDIADAVEKEDVMLLMMSEGVGLLDKEKAQHLETFHMEQYEKLYRENATMVENPVEMLKNANRKYEKINLYHTSQKARLRSRHRLEHLPLELVDSEETALEITPIGCSKGTGLRKICRYMDIPMKQTIAVGDADNDLSILETAGLGVAMKNANKRVKEAANVVVADNDHDGCKQAIEKYLLGD